MFDCVDKNVMRQLKNRHRKTESLNFDTFNLDTFFVWDRQFKDYS